MATEKDIRIRQRVDTNSHWTSTGKLLKNEIGIDSTNNQIRLGTENNQSWNKATVLSDPRETYVEFGGEPLSGTLSPFGATLNEQTNFNVFLGIEKQVTFEYSNDKGATWNNYNLSNLERSAYFGGVTRYTPLIKLGGPVHGAGVDTADELIND